jgi:hypothetical protein
MWNWLLQIFTVKRTVQCKNFFIETIQFCENHSRSFNTHSFLTEYKSNPHSHDTSNVMIWETRSYSWCKSRNILYKMFFLISLENIHQINSNGSGVIQCKYITSELPHARLSASEPHDQWSYVSQFPQHSIWVLWFPLWLLRLKVFVECKNQCRTEVRNFIQRVTDIYTDVTILVPVQI